MINNMNKEVYIRDYIEDMYNKTINNYSVGNSDTLLIVMWLYIICKVMIALSRKEYMIKE